MKPHASTTTANKLRRIRKRVTEIVRLAKLDNCELVFASCAFPRRRTFPAVEEMMRRLWPYVWPEGELRRSRKRVTESMRLAKLSNRELVFEVEHSEAVDFLAVQEMMRRLWPEWVEHECPPDCWMCKQDPRNRHLWSRGGISHE